MNNLPSKVTHSLSFLNDTINSIEDMYDSVDEAYEKIDDIDMDKHGSNPTIRNLSKKVREELDDDLNDILDDYDIYKEDINEIYKNRNDEEIIYISKKYKSLLNDYKDLKKDVEYQLNKIKRSLDEYNYDKEFVKFIALNKVSIPLIRCNKIIDGCIYSLNNLLGIDDKDKK